MKVSEDTCTCALHEKARLHLAKLPILGGDKYLDDILSDRDFHIRSYHAKDILCSRTQYEKALSVILSGRAEAIKGVGGKEVVLRPLGEGDLFGIASLFGEYDAYVSEIRATTSCAVAFIPQRIVTEIFHKDPAAAIAYISLLSDKIRYLNARLDGFAAPSAYSKLCLYLLEKGDCSLSMQTLAETLGISRMTLYRNLDTLVDNGSIAKEGKHITILDREKLTLGATTDQIL